MPEKVDLTGRAFGEWVVLAEAKKRTSDNYVRYICRCSCGNTREVIARSLTSGRSKSCGCKNIKYPKDLTGIRFGKLVVIGEAQRKSYDQCSRWICVCDCGNQTTVIRGSLITDNTKSCGCINGVSHKGINAIDLSGLRFGRLVAVEKLEDDSVERYDKSVPWKCKCDCGNEIIVSCSKLRAGYRKSCGCASVSKKRNVYECVYGKLQDDYVVTTLDGNDENLSPENLYAVHKSIYSKISQRKYNWKGSSELKLTAIKVLELENTIARTEKE